jgi:LCP family protein required for cell wall assembly
MLCTTVYVTLSLLYTQDQLYMPYSPRNSEQRILQNVRRRFGINASKQSRKQRVNTADVSNNYASPPPGSPPRSSQSPVHPPARRKRRLIRILIAVLAITLIIAGTFGYHILAAGNKITVAERSILGQLKDLLFSRGEFLQGEQDGRINIVLMAIGGEGHDGENLADTIIVASVRPRENQAALLSIPRDLYVQVPGEEFYSKLNAVHAYGESKKKNNGPELLQQKVSEITGLPIHYYGRIDFLAFKNIIDAVGGVDITNEKSFYDYWHKISFPAGTERMNGERALAYVRARYVEGSEGGDFKRAARQQQVLLALRDKVFSVQTALDFGRLNAIFNSLAENIRTDMELWELKRLYEIARTIDKAQVQSTVLSTGPKGVLVGETEVLGGSPAAVLHPRTGDYSEIQQIAANLFNTGLATSEPSSSQDISPAPETPPSPSPKQQVTPSPSPPPPKIEVRNGTNITGLAKRISDDLKKKGYEIAAVGNAATRSYTKTTIYTLSAAHTTSGKTLAETLSAEQGSKLPEGEETSSAQIVIILGTDAQ